MDGEQLYVMVDTGEPACCGNCVHWTKRIENFGLDYCVGICKCFPPTIITNDVTHRFPTTAEDTVCGQHSRVED